MPEYPEYRSVLEELKQAFPNGAMIRICDLAVYDGIDSRTARKIYGIKDGVMYIDRTVLARKKCFIANNKE